MGEGGGIQCGRWGTCGAGDAGGGGRKERVNTDEHWWWRTGGHRWIHLRIAVRSRPVEVKAFQHDQRVVLRRGEMG